MGINAVQIFLSTVIGKKIDASLASSSLSLFFILYAKFPPFLISRYGYSCNVGHVVAPKSLGKKREICVNKFMQIWQPALPKCGAITHAVLKVLRLYGRRTGGEALPHNARWHETLACLKPWESGSITQ